jgi:hypothetical protein
MSSRRMVARSDLDVVARGTFVAHTSESVTLSQHLYACDHLHWARRRQHLAHRRRRRGELLRYRGPWHGPLAIDVYSGAGSDGQWFTADDRAFLIEDFTYTSRDAARSRGPDLLRAIAA